METVLNLSNLEMSNNRALNFVVAYYGAIENVNKAVNYVKNALKAYLSIDNVNIYDLDTLWKAEAMPDLLVKKKSFSFRILTTVIMPAFGIYSWSELCQSSLVGMYSPQVVYVYFNRYNVNDPTIVFSYNMDSDKISALDELKGTDCIGIFAQKEK